MVDLTYKIILKTNCTWTIFRNSWGQLCTPSLRARKKEEEIGGSFIQLWLGRKLKRTS